MLIKRIHNHLSEHKEWHNTSYTTINEVLTDLMCYPELQKQAEKELNNNKIFATIQDRYEPVNLQNLSDDEKKEIQKTILKQRGLTDTDIKYLF